MAGGNSEPTLRKYIGAIKDSTTVTLAKVNSDYKELDIAVVKATNHKQHPAREKYIRAIFDAISASRPRADVAYCIHALARRLAKTRNWAVALKTLIVIHRALREVDHTFHEELLNYGRSQSQMLNMAHFKDDSSAEAWDYSAWARCYALFLEERLECFRVLKYDFETDPPRTKDLDTMELLNQLPALQQLQYRLLNCIPQGAASYNVLIQHALTMVALESVKIYTAISDGTINLVDKFFEMQRNDAIRALDIYRRANKQAEKLSEFYEVCKNVHIGRRENFLKIEQPPASFLATMEEYVKDAPTVRSLGNGEKTTVVLAIEYKKSDSDVQEKVTEQSPPPVPEPEPEPELKPEPEPEPEPVKEEPPKVEPTDLLGMNEPSPAATELENRNALALAIVPLDGASTVTPAGRFTSDGSTGWELALVTASSSNESAVASSKLAGGLDMLTLDSLYDEAHRRANQTTSYNPWEMGPMAGTAMQPPTYDPFYASNAVAAPHNVQLAAMAQQQQAFMLQQQMLMAAPQQQAGLNPFGNAYTPTPVNPYGMPVHSGTGYTGLI
ncbi:ENTH/ANTH/VHS superfamily protein [Carex rostrata]